MKKLILFLIIQIAVVSVCFSQNDSRVNLAEKASEMGMLFYYDPLTKNAVLQKRNHQVSFNVSSGILLGDADRLIQTDSPVEDQNGVYVTRNFLNSVETFFATASESDADSMYKVGAILIDPGHGGKDPGAMATHTVNGKTFTIREKDVNLKVGKLLYAKLKAAYPDKKILMTRDTDVFISLSGRTEIANAVKVAPNEAVLYVSVHVNASLDKKSTGYEVWYLSPNYRRQVLKDNPSNDPSLSPILNSMMEEEYTTESVLIAKFILDEIGKQVGGLSYSRGIKAEEWFVVKNSKMPAVLVEVGFLSNAKEAALLNDDNYLQKMSAGIYNGMDAFVKHFEQSRGFTGTK